MNSSRSKNAIGLHLYGRRFAWQSTNNNHSTKPQIREKLTPEIHFELPGWKQLSDKRKGWCYKIIWSVIILSSFLLCGYQTAERIALYMSDPISTEIIVQKNDSVVFPSFIACPNYHTLEKIVPLQKQIAKEMGIFYCNVNLNHIMTRFNYSAMDLWSMVEVGSLLKKPLFNQWMFKTVNRTKLALNVTEVVTTFGTCQKITISDLVQFRKEAYSLQISAIDNYNNCKKNPYAFSVFIRSGDDHVKYHPFSNKVEVQHGVSFIFGITAQQYVHLNTEKHPCSDYATVNKCQDKCIEKHTLNLTTCKLPGTQYESYLRNCSTYLEYRDTVQFMLFAAVLLDYRIDCNCPSVCQETIYKLDLKSMLGSKTTDIWFYFEDNQIDLMREYYSYTIIPLLCDLGGNLGLFLGLCIPSVLENIENLILFVKGKLF